MGSKEPIPGRCGARNRDQSFCASYPLKDRKRCRRHGGRAGRPIIHGLYSQRYRRLSEKLNARIEQLIEDPKLLNLRRPVAVMTYLLEESLTALVEAAEQDPESEQDRQAVLHRCAELADRLSRRQVDVLERSARQVLVRDSVVPVFNHIGRIMTMLVRRYVPAGDQDDFLKEFRVIANRTMAELMLGVKASS